MANRPGEANFFPDVPQFPSMGTFQPVYGKFDLTTYIQGASDYEIMAFLVGKYNACLEAYGTVTKLSTETVQAAHQLQDWINNWFDNLDVQEKLNKKIDNMVQDGSFGLLLHQTFDAQINQQTSSAVTQWLVANVTPTGSAVVVDKSLSIEGAAADAKETGKLKEDLAHLITRSPNLFDKSTELVGKYRYLNRGDDIFNDGIRDNAGYCTNIISVKPNTKYTIKSTNYYTYGADIDGKRTAILNSSTAWQNNLIVTTGSDDYYMVISYGINVSNMMVVEGENMPSEFIPYGFQYGDVLENALIKQEYHVGAGQTYTSFIACIKALKDNANKKTIYVHNGTYDLFDEMGGVDFINSIQSDASWRDINTFIPPNTKIIGIGNVVFNYMPTSEQATVLSAGLISPINCNHSVEIENITVNAQNCRYCIHDESSGWDIYDNTIHKYKNVRAIFHDGGVVGSPSGIAFAGGFGSNVVFDFDNCYFETKRTSGGAFYLHNWKSIGTNGSLISLKNCVLLNLSDNLIALQLGNLQNNTTITENVVSVDNCYLKGKISVIKVSSGDTSNTFNVKALKSASSVEIDSRLINEFVPQIYN